MPLIDPNRLIANFERVAAVGRSPDGATHRLALSAQDHEVRTLFITMIMEANLFPRIDQYGNIWGCTQDCWNAPAIVAGSHLDSVPGGGAYDGAVGVLAALEAVRVILEAGTYSETPFAVVNFASEESSRFGVSTIGSRGVAGLLSVDATYQLRDKQGVTFGEALLQHAGYELVDLQARELDRSRMAQCPNGLGSKDAAMLCTLSARSREPGPIGCYLELHIEQGRELEVSGVPIGIVSRIAAPTRFRVNIEGVASHSGSTLMRNRKDALVAAATLVLDVEKIALEEECCNTVATTTVYGVHPASMNTVPGRVELGIDIRGTDIASKGRTVARFRDAVQRVAQQREINVNLELVIDEDPVVLPKIAVDCIRLGCERAGLAHIDIESRGGHDARNMAQHCPSAMLFIPSRDGIGHHPNEYAAAEHMILGTTALLEAMLCAAETLI